MCCLNSILLADPRAIWAMGRGPWAMGQGAWAMATAESLHDSFDHGKNALPKDIVMATAMAVA